MKDKTPLFQRTVVLIQNIPEGCVLSYGGVAELIGAPGCGRHVSYILSSSSRKYKLPWHRVLSSTGKIPNHSSATKQIKLLEREGIEIDNRSIDFKRYQWNPKKKELNKILKGLPKHVSIYLRN